MSPVRQLPRLWRALSGPPADCAAANADGAPIRVTVSVGVAALAPAGETIEALLERADEALHEAEREGRNRVVGAMADFGAGHSPFAHSLKHERVAGV